jgi:exodeoxyribonuclease-3
MKKTLRTITVTGMLLTAVSSFVTPLDAEPQKLSEKPGKELTIRIMTYNVCRGGTYQGQPLSQSAKMIKMAKADIVGLQEIGENVPKLAELLGWNHSGPFLTRYEIIEEIKGISRRPSDGIKVRLTSGQEAYVFNNHLPHPPYQPYQLLGLTAGYRVYPKIDTEAEAIAGAKKTRGRFITRLFKQIRTLPDQEAPVFVVGDFNEPSHLDWTEAAAKSGRHPMKVEFPTSLMMAQAGYIDAYRTVHPDEMAKPGFTWTPLKKADDPTIHHDRIDYVYFKGKGLKVIDAKVIGESKENADIVVSPYPSDHRAVVATITLAKQADSEKPNAGDGK